MKTSCNKIILSTGLMLCSLLAFGQLPYSPCGPGGGKRADLLGAEAKYKAPGGSAPTFTIPAGTKSITVYTSSETGITTGSDNPQGDEDFITINAIIDIASNTSSGYVNYAKNTNADGSGTNVYGWRDVALGTFIPVAGKIGDASPDLNNVNFSITGSTLTITESATSIHTSYYVEYLSPYINSLNPLDPQVKALLHGTAAANTDLVIPIPAGTNILSISGKGTNSSYTDLNTTNGTEEGYANLRFTIDLDAGLTDGFITLSNGGTIDRRSTYVINDLSSSATGSLVSSSSITGDYTAKLTSAGAVGLFNPQVYISGANLVIKRDADYARDFDDAYVIEFYHRVGQGMSAEFISTDIKDIPKGLSSTTGVTRTFKIPPGTNTIYFNETGNAVNGDRESNENSLAAYAYIDLTTETATGYFYQQVGLSGTLRRDDNYAFKGVPLNNTSTSAHANTVGFRIPNDGYGISFSLSADKSELSVTNKTGLANPAYQFLLAADYYGSKPDIAFSSTANITFSKGSACNIVKTNTTVCNPGAGNSNGGMPISFYHGDPTVDPSATLLHTSTFNQDVATGTCKNFSFDIDLTGFNNLNIDLTIIINDNGSFVPGGVGNTVGTPFTLASLANQNSAYKECYYDNNLVTRTINVNNCPLVNLDTDNSSGATGNYNYLDYFNAGSSTGTKIADTDPGIVDPDADDVYAATITLTNVLDAGNENLYLNGTLPAGITISGNGTSVVTLSGQATRADYMAALQMIEYKNTNGSPNTTNRIITTTVNDGTETGPASTTTIVILTNPRMNVTGNGITIADNSTIAAVPDGTDLGTSAPGGSVVDHTFSIGNVGTGIINLTATPAVNTTGDVGFTISTQPATNSIASGANTSFVVRFNTAGHAVGTYTATVRIVNNDPDADQADYTFTVSATVNNLPVITNNSVSGNEDETIAFNATDFTANYSDGDGAALNKIQIIDLPLNGSFQLNGAIITVGQEIPFSQLGNITFIPTANWNGTTDFEWNASDGTSYTANTVYTTINIISVNDAPVITLPTSLAVTEDIPVSLAGISFTDIDAGAGNMTVTFTVPDGTCNAISGDGVVVGGTPLALTLNGTLDDINAFLAADKLTYSTSQDPPASLNLTVHISDNGSTGTGGPLADTKTLVLGITAINDAPTGTGDTKTISEDTPVSGAVTATDPDGDALTFIKATDPANGTVVVNTDGTYTYTPNAGYNGPDNFTINISDGNGGSTTVTVNITVTPVNDAPTGTGDTKTTNEDTPVSGAVTGTDLDSDPLTFTKATDPAHGTAVVNADGTYTYTPNADYNGPDNFTINISDGNGGTTTVTVNITVTPVNDAPTGTGDTKTTNEDTPVSGAVTGTDLDRDPLTFTKATDPAHGTAAVNADGTYTYTPNADYNGPDNFTINISDGNGGTTTVTVNINVLPTAGNAGITLVKAGVVRADRISITYTFTITNTGKATLHDVTVTDPMLGLNRTFSGNLLPGGSLTETAVYRLTQADRDNGSVSNTATVNGQTPENTAITDLSGTAGDNDMPTETVVPKSPVALDDEADTRNNNPVTITLLTNDDAGHSTFNTSTVAIITQPQHGQVIVHPDGTVTYTPESSYNGADNFTYRVQDADGYLTNVATVTLGVQFGDFKAPTLFTPNGDGKNDAFEIRGLNQYTESELVIINRWGNEVYRQKNYQNNWHGDGLSEGTYYYVLRIKKINGSGWEVLKGYTTLIRTFRK